MKFNLIDYNLNDNFNYNKVELSEKNTNFNTMNLKNKMMIFLKNYYILLKILQTNVMMNKKNHLCLTLLIMYY